MKNNDLYNLFMDELKDMLSSENQIIVALPKMIKLASLEELKEALSHHLNETKEQVVRLKKIFSILGEKPEEITCEGMQGILGEGEEIVAGKNKSSLLDAAIISAAQKVEHYEMASYGTLRSFAKQLELDSQIAKLLQTSLDEEGAADKKLTKIAEGSFFSAGVNKVAAGR